MCNSMSLKQFFF